MIASAPAQSIPLIPVLVPSPNDFDYASLSGTVPTQQTGMFSVQKHFRNLTAEGLLGKLTFLH